MDENDFEDLFDSTVQDIFETDAINESLDKIPENARKFRNMKEISEYMMPIVENFSERRKIEAWSLLIKNLSTDVLDENLKGLLEKISEYRDSEIWYNRYLVEQIIDDLPEEIKSRNFEELCEFILSEKEFEDSSPKWHRIYAMPFNFKQPQNYKKVLNLIETGMSKETINYKELLKLKILYSLPEDFVFQNYEEVSSDFFSTTTIDRFEIANFAKKVFNIEVNNEEERLKEVFSLFKSQIDNFQNENKDNKTEILRNVIEILPTKVIRPYIEDLLPIMKNEKFSRFFEYEENESIDNEILLKNMILVAETIRSRNEYEHVITREQLEIIKLLPESFIKENAKTCFEVFNVDTYKEFISTIFDKPEKDNYEDLQTVINLLGENLDAKIGEYSYKKKEVFSIVEALLPEDFVKENVETLIKNFDEETFKKLYQKIFEVSENETIDNELTLKNATLILDNLEKQNLNSYTLDSEHKKIIEIIPNEFFKDNIEFCFTKFSKEVYSNFLSKAFSYKTEDVENEEIKVKLEYVKNKIDESFDYENILEKLDANKCWDEVITTLPENFIKLNAEYMITLLDNKMTNNAKNRFLQIIPEEIIAKNEHRLVNNINFENIGNCKRYLEYIVTNPNMSIITSDIGIKLFNFVNLNKDSSNPEFLEIKEIIEKEKSKYQNLDMSKYSGYLPKEYSENSVYMDKTVFENFISDLEKLKILNGYIPEEYCDYIIKQKLTKESPLNEDLEKYLPMLKRAFEDKVQHMLLKEGIENYTIEFFEKDGNTLGTHNKATRTIGFLEDNLIELDVSNTHIINTAFHEVKHAIQAKYYDSTDFSKLDGSMYNMIKEEIIRANDIGFYNRNYTRMYCEIDARTAGARGQAEYLKYLGIPDDQIIENVGSTKKTLKEIVESNQQEEEKNTNYASNKVDQDGKIVSISQKAAELIKKNPDWLKQYPVLSLEFYESGERKKTTEILNNAILCNDKSIQDIYIKIFEQEIKVRLEDSAETLEYISRLLKEDNKPSENIINFANLIIRNETFTSLQDNSIDDIECKRILQLLNEISKNNPNLEISNYINEMLSKFLDEGKIEVETKKDDILSDAAISMILSRPIKSMEDLESILKDLPKVMIDKEKYDWNLSWGFKKLFENHFCKESDLDFSSMLEKTLENISDANRNDIMKSFWEVMPQNMQAEHIGKFVEICSKYREVNFDFAYETMSKMNRDEIIEKSNLPDEIFGKYLQQELIPFLKIPINEVELGIAIKEAENRDGKYEDIKLAVDKVVREESKKGNPDSIEMLYSQLEYLKGKYDKSSAITTFLIYASDELKVKNIEQVLRHTLIEKDYFDEERVNSLIDKAKDFIDREIFDENPGLLSAIDEIQKEAVEKAKSRVVELEVENIEIPSRQVEKIKTIEEFYDNLQTLKNENEDEWSLKWEIRMLLNNNLNRDSNLDPNLMLEMVLKIAPENLKNDLMDVYWEELPEDMRLENIREFVELCSENREIDFEFAYQTMDKLSKDEMMSNPNLSKELFERHLSQGLMPFLRMPKTIEEVEEVIKEAKSKNGDYDDINLGMDQVVRMEASKGNPASIEMLYGQLEHLNDKFDKRSAISKFFIYANNDLKEKNAEPILRYVLIEKDYFDEQLVTSIIDSTKNFIGSEIFDKNPELLSKIDEIHLEALNKRMVGQVDERIEEHKADKKTNDLQNRELTEKEEMTALQEIRKGIQPSEMSKGKEMIKFFLSKAKEFKNKIGKFLKGGDDYDDR